MTIQLQASASSPTVTTMIPSMGTQIKISSPKAAAPMTPSDGATARTNQQQQPPATSAAPARESTHASCQMPSSASQTG